MAIAPPIVDNSYFGYVQTFMRLFNPKFRQVASFVVIHREQSPLLPYLYKMAVHLRTC